jgi:hypothetical protein
MTMFKITKKKALVAGIATVVVVGGASAALAFWSTTGTGNGSATTGTSTALVVTVADLTAGDLSPNGPTDNVTFTVQNTNSGAQNYSNAVATVTSTSNAGCTAADFNISNLATTYGDLQPNATANGSFDLKMIDTGLNQDACKGVTVHLKVDVS